MNSDHEKRLKAWLKSDELPGDFYELIGLARFFDQRQPILEAVEAAYRFVHDHEQHADAKIRNQAFQFERLLGQAHHLVAHPDKWKVYDNNLVHQLFGRYWSDVGDAATDRVRRWLDTTQNIHPARIDWLVQAFVALAQSVQDEGMESVGLAEPSTPKKRRRTSKREPASQPHPPAAKPLTPGLKRRYQTVGIDLGTTYSAIAYIDKEGEPQVVNNPEDHRPILPSAVFFEGDDIIVGEDALSSANVYPGDVVQFAKRAMGEPASYLMGEDQREYSPETISAIILKKLVTYAEPTIGPITKAVITVPAYFNEKRRAATEHAGTIAGLEVAAVLNEPSAALIAYGLHEKKEQEVYVVYDLGGGTFDVTVMRVGDGKLQELASGGNRKLGGCDWDEALLNHVAGKFVDEHEADPRDDAVSYQTLLTDCRRVKVQLSSRKRANLRCTHAGKTLAVEITRNDFEKLTAKLLGKTQLTFDACLNEAGCRLEQVAGVVLVGGSTAMPAVHEMIRQISRKEPLASVDPELAVVRGAAVYAGVLETSGPVETLRAATYTRHEGDTSEKPAKAGIVAFAPARHKSDTDRVSEDLDVPLDLTLVNAHGIGVFAMQRGEPVNVVMIPKNSKLPKTETRLFKLRRDKMRRLTVVITEGDSEQRSACEVLGTCYLGPLPALPKGTAIELRLGYRKDGRVQVSARCLDSKRAVHAELQTESILTPKEVDQERRALAERDVG